MGAKRSTDAAETRIADGARTIARDLTGPAGRIALDRVVARHLGFFDLCDERDMTWRQIAAMLHGAGAGRANGLPFSENQLSSVVSRQRKRVQRKRRRRTDHNAPGCESKTSKSAIVSTPGFEPLRRDDRAHLDAIETYRAPDRNASFDARSNSLPRPDDSAAKGDGAFRATLDRAARLRRTTDDA